MQKKLIAIAVAAALVPAAAMAADIHEAASGGTHPSVMGTTGTTLYGRIHTSIDSITGQNATNSLSVQSSASRFGVKGSEDLGNGLKAVYQLESGVAAVGGTGTADGNGSNAGASGSLFSKQRDTYIGLAGNFGTFLVGRLPAANQYVYDSNLFVDQIGDAASFTNASAPDRANSALHYVLPGMSGFSAALTYLPANSMAANSFASGENSWGVKLGYAGSGVTVNFAYFNLDTTGAVAGEVKPTSLAGSYDFGNGLVTAQYVRSKVGTVSQNIYNIGGQFNVASNAAIKAQYSNANDQSGTGAAANTGGSMFAIGYDYSLSKRTGVYVAYAAVNNDSGANFNVANWGHGNTGAQSAGEDGKGFSVGLTHNF